MTYLNSLSLASPSQQRRSRFSPAAFNSSLVPSFTQLQILGPTDPSDLRGGSHRVLPDVEGHCGCVNAIDWEDESSNSFVGGSTNAGGSGSVGAGRLASAGDDTKICIWRPGLLKVPPSDSINNPSRHPPMNLGLEACIDTGHSANIFAIKWAPGSSSRLFTCAGDRQVRIFDVNAALTPSTKKSRTKDGIVRTWNHYETSSACTRVLRCHQGRVKKIATEDSSECFLTCSEDGAVRQHDLRVDHTCHPNRSSCGPPLLHYPNLQLYSLSISKARPHLFVVAGTSPYAFLHDRRMIRSSMMSDWGMDMMGQEDGGGATQCVRRFGALRDDGTEIDQHITATKLGESTGRDLLLSYSNDLIYLFDTDADPETKPVQISPRSSAKANPFATDEEDEGWEHAEMDPDETMREAAVLDSGQTTPGAAIASSNVKRGAESDDTGPEGEHKRRREEYFDLEDGDAESETLESSDGLGEGGHDADLSPFLGSFGTTDSDGDSDLDSTTPVHLQDSAAMGQLEEDVPIVRPKQKYSGHLNSETVKDVNFAFNDLNVMSGSDDGNLFIWDKETGRLRAIFEGDSNVVNVMKPHPLLPILAVSGIDATVKIFGPTSDPEEEVNLLAHAHDITRRNDDRRSANRFDGRMSQTLVNLFSRAAPGVTTDQLRLAIDGREQECLVM